jgi:hypothetical protein
MRLSPAQIDELKARVDLVKLAGDMGAELRRHGAAMMGSCPLCGGSKKTTRFEVKGDKWVCAACSEGGDALALVQKVRGLDFRAAVEFLGGAATIDAEQEARLERERAAREKQRAEVAAKMRAGAIASAWRLWHGAGQFDLASVRSYLEARGCALPGTAEIHFGRQTPYFHGEIVDPVNGKKSPRVLCRGPAMLSAVRDNAGEFVAVHLTYLNDDCSGKARIENPDFNPETDDEKLRYLPAKKQRGAKKGGHITLRHHPEATRLFLGEGIETVLSVATALRATGKLAAGDAFWSACDLGNLGGDAVESVRHPTLKQKNGPAMKVPGPLPDMDSPGIAIPASVTRLVLLGDGDSDPFTTQMAMKRAAARYRRDGLHIAIVWAPKDMDFNDILLGRAPATDIHVTDGAAA